MQKKGCEILHLSSKSCHSMWTLACGWEDWWLGFSTISTKFQLTIVWQVSRKVPQKFCTVRTWTVSKKITSWKVLLKRKNTTDSHSESPASHTKQLEPFSSRYMLAIITSRTHQTREPQHSTTSSPHLSLSLSPTWKRKKRKRLESTRRGTDYRDSREKKTVSTPGQ